MKILFDTIEEKEEFIEESAIYNEDEDCDVYVCPVCHSHYEDFESCVDCCPCSKEEVYDSDLYDSSDDDY